MEIILLIISSFLGILGVLIEPVKKGKGSVFKRLTGFILAVFVKFDIAA
ncbi:MAG: hypothetical protein J7577_00575 [Sphingobacteriaceae bacterium]|nr:hypothetical protein [Sphingobacteriaceae bacterium]